MDFTLADEYITDVFVYREGNFITDGKETLTDDDLVKLLQGKGKWSSTSTADHPEYAKLRDELEVLGYIETQRNCWNGDHVLKPFKLNGVRFKKGEQFSCGAAMKWHLDYCRKHGR